MVIPDLHLFVVSLELQAFSQDYNTASHITNVVCLNFLHYWQELQFKTDTDWYIIYSQSLCPKSAERESHRCNIFSDFVLLQMSGLGFELWPHV